VAPTHAIRREGGSDPGDAGSSGSRTGGCHRAGQSLGARAGPAGARVSTARGGRASAGRAWRVVCPGGFKRPSGARMLLGWSCLWAGHSRQTKRRPGGGDSGGAGVGFAGPLRERHETGRRASGQAAARDGGRFDPGHLVFCGSRGTARVPASVVS
jgi:hypothetical protein